MGDAMAARVGVSLVIPHFGDPRLALQLVEEIRRSQTSFPLQIIVSDDASPQPFPKLEGVDIVRRQANGGFGSAVNSGVALAAYPLLMILNSDLRFAPDFLETFVTTALPWMPGVAGPCTFGATGHQAWTGRRFPSLISRLAGWLAPLTVFSGKNWYLDLVGYEPLCVAGAVVKVDWLVGACLLMPTEAFTSIGGFDERFYMNSEEIDLQLRLSHAGVYSVFLGNSQVIHSAGSSTDSLRSIEWRMESQIEFARKWGWGTRLQVGMTLTLILNTLWRALWRVAGRHGDPLGSHLRLLKVVWRRERRPT